MRRACGYSYRPEELLLRRLDRLLHDQGLAQASLPKTLVDAWTAKRVHERPKTQAARVVVVRQLARYLLRQGITAHVPDGPAGVPVRRSDFVPYIFTRIEVRRLLHAVDTMRFDGHAPLRRRVMAEVFRVLYACGLRLSEALHLTSADVDLVAGVLAIRGGKFRKDRLVPLAPGVASRLRRYARLIQVSGPASGFFPAPHGGPYSGSCLDKLFRELVWHASIRYHGPGYGPRIHDLRHSFAVHRLARWYREGADLGAKLPILSAYMGHSSLTGTQTYLRLTAELFPDLVAVVERRFGHIIPVRPANEAD